MGETGSPSNRAHLGNAAPYQSRLERSPLHRQARRSEGLRQHLAVAEHVGKKGGQPWEALVWLYLIRARSVTVVLQGSKLEIVQGSPDSPAIFRASIGETIDEVLKEMGGISRRTPNCHRAHIGVPASWTTCTCGVITDVGLSKRQSASKTSRQCCWGAGGGGQ